MLRLIRAILLALLGTVLTVHIFSVIIQGTQFAWTDNIIVVIMALFVGRLFLIKGWRAEIGGAFGAGIGNAISDDLGAIIDASMGLSWVPGITYGCLVPLLFIPLFTIIADYLMPMTRKPDGAVSRDEHYHAPNAKHMHGEYKLGMLGQRTGRWCVCEACGYEWCQPWPDASKSTRNMYKPGYECTMCAQHTRKLIARDEETRIVSPLHDYDEDIDVYVGDGIGNDNGL